ncbi:junctional adhesion molecule A isoform X1 [Podarcis muralis]|uniref:Junctional adhesion molecule A n=1 Tax=Podarcis muralis TaxID=64176 RepID=A0A670JQ69_PODMU|nr:junctional adhesion molecule A isoform X2 [Podarcis muralis]
MAVAAMGWLWWGCFCAGLWSLISGQSSQETLVQVPENSEARLPCKAYQGSPRRVEWKFQGDGSTTLFYFDGHFTDPYKDRVQFYPNELFFKSVTRKDTGLYICEVLVPPEDFRHSSVRLIVQVPPSKPKAQVPSVVTIGTKAVLTCVETDGSPPPTFTWFKDNIPMPQDPKTNSLFRNSSYTMDPKTGLLSFEPAMAYDAGDYYCQADNKVGAPQKSDTVRMETSEVNVGGIVAGVVVLLIVLGLVIFGVWFAYTRGFFSTPPAIRRSFTANLLPEVMVNLNRRLPSWSDLHSHVAFHHVLKSNLSLLLRLL